METFQHKKMKIWLSKECWRIPTLFFAYFVTKKKLKQYWKLFVGRYRNTNPSNRKGKPYYIYLGNSTIDISFLVTNHILR